MYLTQNTQQVRASFDSAREAHAAALRDCQRRALAMRGAYTVERERIGSAYTYAVVRQGADIGMRDYAVTVSQTH